jgi:hypothetical protein
MEPPRSFTTQGQSPHVPPHKVASEHSDQPDQPDPVQVVRSAFSARSSEWPVDPVKLVDFCGKIGIARQGAASRLLQHRDLVASGESNRIPDDTVHL